MSSKKPQPAPLAPSMMTVSPPPPRKNTMTDELKAAAEFALKHLEELREAWRTGAIRDIDGLGGTRSNRNVEAEVRLRKALSK